MNSSERHGKVARMPSFPFGLIFSSTAMHYHLRYKHSSWGSAAAAAAASLSARLCRRASSMLVSHMRRAS